MPDTSGQRQAAGTTRDEAARIAEQRRAITEMQNPVIEVWEGILALPIVGTLDTARAQEMNEVLLQKIVDTGSEIVILDITGVPLVDTAIAKHLLETVSAARLLGCEVMIVGLSSKTAMTMVHLGIDLSMVTTRTTLAKGLELAFNRLGFEITRHRDTAARRSLSPDGGL